MGDKRWVSILRLMNGGQVFVLETVRRKLEKLQVIKKKDRFDLIICLDSTSVEPVYKGRVISGHPLFKSGQ